MTEENRVVRESDSDAEQMICGFIGSEFFDRVCEDHETPEVSH